MAMPLLEGSAGAPSQLLFHHHRQPALLPSLSSPPTPPPPSLPRRREARGIQTGDPSKYGLHNPAAHLEKSHHDLKYSLRSKQMGSIGEKRRHQAEVDGGGGGGG